MKKTLKRRLRCNPEQIAILGRQQLTSAQGRYDVVDTHLITECFRCQDPE